MSLPQAPAPHNLCILRLSAIGDVTHVVPVIRTLQRHWPDCNITWVIGKLEATLVKDLPGVEFIIFDKSAGMKSFINLRRVLARRRFDVLLDMQVALRASFISLAINSPIKLGFDKARAHDYQWLFTNAKIAAEPRQHVLDGFFGFLRQLGIDEKILEWDIPIPAAADDFIAQQLPTKDPILVINPCSSAKLRNWPVARYAAIADYASHQHGLQVVLSGGPTAREHDVANTVCALSHANIINLTGKTSLKELLALLKRATVLLAPDTGPAHMATAVNTPVIGLFASSNPARTGPYLSQQWVVNKYAEAAKQELGLDEAQLRWGQRIRKANVMDYISINDVRQKLDALIGRGGRSVRKLNERIPQ